MTTTDVVGNLLAESGMAGDAALTAVLTDLRDLAAGPPPEPSPELAALLAGGFPAETVVLPTPVLPLSRRRRAAAGVGAVVLAAVASTGVAAAANQLPSGAQRLAAQFSDHFLPFNFPLPREAGPLTPGLLGPRGSGHPQHPDGPAAQGTAPPATLDPGTPSDHPVAQRGGHHDGHHGDDNGATGDGRDGDRTHHRDGPGARSDDGDRSDGTERTGRTEAGSGGGGADGSRSDGGEQAGTAGGGSGTSGGDGGSDGSGDGGSDTGPDQGPGGGTDVPDVAGVLPQ